MPLGVVATPRVDLELERKCRSLGRVAASRFVNRELDRPRFKPEARNQSATYR